MVRSRPGLVRLRAIIGVVALYGLLVQAFLAAAIPVPSVAATGVICAEHAAGSPSKDTPVRHEHQCCTALQAGTLSPPPSPSYEAAWPARLQLALTWRHEAAAPRTGPPPRPQSARGPPAA